MLSRKRGTRGRRVPAALAAMTFTALAVVGHDRPRLVGASGPQAAAQTSAAARAQTAAPSPFVGLWHATLPNGPRAASITVVPAGGGSLSGTFLGYDYDRPIDPSRPAASGDAPKVSMHSGSALINPSVDGSVLSFSMQLRPAVVPAGAPEFFNVRGEMRLTGDGAGELRLFSPKKPEPLTLQLVRE